MSNRSSVARIKFEAPKDMIHQTLRSNFCIMPDCNNTYLGADDFDPNDTLSNAVFLVVFVSLTRFTSRQSMSYPPNTLSSLGRNK